MFELIKVLYEVCMDIHLLIFPANSRTSMARTPLEP